jgi:hypothetical protein
MTNFGECLSERHAGKVPEGRSENREAMCKQLEREKGKSHSRDSKFYPVLILFTLLGNSRHEVMSRKSQQLCLSFLICESSKTTVPASEWWWRC